MKSEAIYGKLITEFIIRKFQNFSDINELTHPKLTSSTDNYRHGGGYIFIKHIPDGYEEHRISTCKINRKEGIIGLFKRIETIRGSDDVNIDELPKAYGDVFCDFNLTTKIINIYSDGNKIKFYFRINSKYRCVGNQFIKKQVITETLTFNLKTNNYFYYNSINKPKLKSKFVRQNYNIVNKFNDFKSVGKDIQTQVIDILKSHIYNEGDIEYVNNIFNKSEIYSTGNLLYDFILEWKCVKNRLKLPNNTYILDELFSKIGVKKPISNKLIKQNGGNLVNAILESYGIKRGFYNKLLNTSNHHPTCYAVLDKIIGVEYIRKLKFKCVDKYEQHGCYNNINRIDGRFPLSISEKNKIIKLLTTIKLNDTDEQVFDQSKLDQIFEHCTYRQKILECGYNIKIEARDAGEFNNEHERFGRLVAALSSVRRKRTFNQYMIEQLEGKPIHEDIYPVFLKTTDDYINEGQINKHCVGAYDSETNVFIISFRKGSPESTERSTMEFGVSCGIRQHKGFTNTNPVDCFHFAARQMVVELKKLSDRGIDTQPIIECEERNITEGELIGNATVDVLF